MSSDSLASSESPISRAMCDPLFTVTPAGDERSPEMVSWEWVSLDESRDVMSNDVDEGTGAFLDSIIASAPVTSVSFNCLEFTAFFGEKLRVSMSKLTAWKSIVLGTFFVAVRRRRLGDSAGVGWAGGLSAAGECVDRAGERGRKLGGIEAMDLDTVEVPNVAIDVRCDDGMAGNWIDDLRGTDG